VELQVNGTLNAIGTFADSIYFRPDTTYDCDTLDVHPQPGDWYGIYVNQNASCSLSYCSVVCATNGIENRNNSMVSISNSNISDNSDDGIHNYKGILSVENSVINNNGLSGIWGNNSDNFIYGTRLIGNAKYGINLTGPRTGSTDSTLIQYDTLSSGGILSNYAISITNIDSIRIYKCKARGYAQGGLYLYNSDALVTNNDFSANQIYGIFAHDYSYPTIRQCRIDTLAIGVKAYKAKPNIGTVTPDSPGNCSFLRNTQYYIYYAPPGIYDTLWAQHNWFFLMPGGGMFYSPLKTAPIVYNPTLLSPPPEPRLDPGQQPIPLVFELRQNYPNPFNPTTIIAFSLDEPNQTLITIYNLLGRRITTLMDEYRPAGEHSVIWNGKDGHGKRFHREFTST
jgi:hypothetical protein